MLTLEHLLAAYTRALVARRDAEEIVDMTAQVAIPGALSPDEAMSMQAHRGEAFAALADARAELVAARRSLERLLLEQNDQQKTKASTARPGDRGPVTPGGVT